MANIVGQKLASRIRPVYLFVPLDARRVWPSKRRPLANCCRASSSRCSGSQFIFFLFLSFCFPADLDCTMSKSKARRSMKQHQFRASLLILLRSGRQLDIRRLCGTKLGADHRTGGLKDHLSADTVEAISEQPDEPSKGFWKLSSSSSSPVRTRSESQWPGKQRHLIKGGVFLQTWRRGELDSLESSNCAN